MAELAVVTGGSGFVGTELVKQLLEKGYSVRATVRSVADASRTDHLRHVLSDRDRGASSLPLSLFPTPHPPQQPVLSFLPALPRRRLGEALPGSLELVEADLLKEGSFDAAVRGAQLVFHVASPFQFPSEGVEEKVIEPAVKCANAGPVWRRPGATSGSAACAVSPRERGVPPISVESPGWRGDLEHAAALHARFP